MKYYWKTHGLLIKPLNNNWSKSHCMLPTLINLNNKTTRVFYATRNTKNQSVISYADIHFDKNDEILRVQQSKYISLDIGELGNFDDNGVLPSSLIKIKKKYLMYYIGWQPRSTTRYSLKGGLAISSNCKNFKRVSKSPILFNNEKESIDILTAPFVIKEKRHYKMWYVSGIKWVSKNFPLYDIKSAISKNGINWVQTKETVLKLKKSERALARPNIFFENTKLKMFYSYEKKVGNYKIGYALNKGNNIWKREDKKVKFIDKSPFEKNMQEYPNILIRKKKTYLFYNGDNYGKDGILLASLV